MSFVISSVAMIPKDLFKMLFCFWQVHWPRSPEIQLGAIHYALLNQNHEALKLLLTDLKSLSTSEPYLPRKNEPTVSLDRMDTGT